MKQLTKRILSLALALMMFATVAGTASALSHDPAGSYIWVGGSCEQSEILINILNTNTFVKTNPDHAYLVTKVKFTDGLKYTDEESAMSGIDVTSFDTTFTVREAIDLTPHGVYSTHAVQGGTDEKEGYAYYTYTVVDVS